MIIQSLLDNDAYKFFMQQMVYHQFPNVQVEYKFKCRTKGVDLVPLKDEIEKEIWNYCTLTFNKEELDFIAQRPFLTSDYVDFLRIFRHQREFFFVYVNEQNELEIRLKGPWLHTILAEVPVLAIVEEVYMTNTYPDLDIEEGRKRLKDKISLVLESTSCSDEFRFADFCTRRRESMIWQDEMVGTCVKTAGAHFLGTSNGLFAKKYGIPWIGTMAHETFQVAQALTKIDESQKFMLDCWVREFRGALGIALTDCISMDAFLKDFDLFFCKLFDGCRHDSGDPYEWCEKLIAHYEKMKIDPKTKTAVFSDGLDFPSALAIAKYFAGRIKTSFGIGTNLGNDFGVDPIQIVLKVIAANGRPVAKISDSPGKNMCEDPVYVKMIKHIFGIELMNA